MPDEPPQKARSSGLAGHWGAGAGAIVALLLVSFAKQLELNLTPAQAGVIATALIVGLGWLAHVIVKAWTGPGLWPALRRGILGRK